MYYLKSSKGWYLPNAYGYTQKKEEAGLFEIDDLKALNLDGVTLHSSDLYESKLSTIKPNLKNP